MSNKPKYVFQQDHLFSLSSPLFVLKSENIKLLNTGKKGNPSYPSRQVVWENCEFNYEKESTQPPASSLLLSVPTAAAISLFPMESISP